MKANRGGRAVMKGVEVLRRMNRRIVFLMRRKRTVPADVPTSFVRKRWRPFVFSGTGGEIDRHGWELCLLSELRGRLRSGDVYLEQSRRHADPESYLIPEEEWPKLKGKVCEQLGLTASGKKRLSERAGEVKRLLRHLDELLSPSGRSAGEVRLEHGAYGHQRGLRPETKHQRRSKRRRGVGVCNEAASPTKPDGARARCGPHRYR